MRVISTVICLFSAFIMIATPVMACCITGHVDNTPGHVSQNVSAVKAPPCHGSLETAAQTKQAPEKFCHSCDDCAVSPAQVQDMSPAVSASGDIDFVAQANTHAANRETDLRLPESTGPPPRRRLSPIDKPLFPTDTLLI